MRRNLLYVCILLLTGCTSLFFQPQREHIENPVIDNFSYKDVYFKSSDGVSLHGWFLTAHGDDYGTILYLHGNAENLSTHVNYVLWLVSAGFNVFIFDYRGYGRSEGIPTVKGVHLDAEAALDTVLKMPEVRRDNLFVIGQSLGGAIAVYTIANSPNKKYIKALIIDSTFAGYRMIASEKLTDLIITLPLRYPLSMLVNDYYSPVRWIRGVYPVPILIIHGENDDVVPVHHGKILYENAMGLKDIWITQAEGHIQSFLEEGIREKLLQYLIAKRSHYP